MTGATTPPAPPAQTDNNWMEIFHSKPSMPRCYFLEKRHDGTFTSPSPSNELRDAAHIRAGFRVMRRRATPVEFVLTNGTDRNWDDNNGRNYVLDAVPGRYVVEHSIRRVGDADPLECFQAVARSADRFVQLSFRADLWARCFVSYQRDGAEWTPAPGVEMKLEGSSPPTLDAPPSAATASAPPTSATAAAAGVADAKAGDAPRHALGGERRYFISIEAQRLALAFNDGGDVWDANGGANYLIGLPGKYEVGGDGVSYVSPSDIDLRENRVIAHPAVFAFPAEAPRAAGPAVATPLAPAARATQ